MLDVHPPHQAAHTWTDFLIHIATIVVGLLIALGLEQTVEHVHLRHELNETRVALKREQRENEALWAQNEHGWRTVFVELKNNLTVLQYLRSHPGTVQNQLPGELRWVQGPFQWEHAAWDAAVQNGVVRLMATEEANINQQYYQLMSEIGEQSSQAWDAINAAHRFDFLDADPAHLSTAQLDEVIQLTLIALQKHVTQGYSLGLFAKGFPERPHSITWDTMETLRPLMKKSEAGAMTEAHRITEERLNLANSGPNGTSIDPRALQ